MGKPFVEGAINLSIILNIAIISGIFLRKWWFQYFNLCKFMIPGIRSGDFEDCASLGFFKCLFFILEWELSEAAHLSEKCVWTCMSVHIMGICTDVWKVCSHTECFQWFFPNSWQREPYSSQILFASLWSHCPSRIAQTQDSALYRGKPCSLLLTAIVTNWLFITITCVRPFWKALNHSINKYLVSAPYMLRCSLAAIKAWKGSTEAWESVVKTFRLVRLLLRGAVMRN